MPSIFLDLNGTIGANNCHTIGISQLKMKVFANTFPYRIKRTCRGKALIHTLPVKAWQRGCGRLLNISVCEQAPDCFVGEEKKEAGWRR